MTDPAGELARDSRARMFLIVAAVIGIVTGAVLGIGFAIGALDAPGASGARNPAAAIFFVGPFVVCMAVGWLIYKIARR